MPEWMECKSSLEYIVVCIFLNYYSFLRVLLRCGVSVCVVWMSSPQLRRTSSHLPSLIMMMTKFNSVDTIVGQPEWSCVTPTTAASFVCSSTRSLSNFWRWQSWMRECTRLYLPSRSHTVTFLNSQLLPNNFPLFLAARTRAERQKDINVGIF